MYIYTYKPIISELLKNYNLTLAYGLNILALNF